MRTLDEAFSYACARLDRGSFSQLEQVDKILVTIWGLEADVNNGGFHQYYFNSSGDQAFYAPEALEFVGAHQMASIVSRANEVFSPEGPSPDRRARQAQLFLVEPNNSDMPSRWNQLDRAFWAYPDDIAMLLTAYLRTDGRLTN